MTLTDARVHVHFTPLERLFTGRTSHTVPVSAIVSADVDAEPIGRLRGARRGLTVSGFAKIGVVSTADAQAAAAGIGLVTT